MSKTRIKEQNLLLRLVSELKNRTVVTDVKSEFYGKVDFRVDTTSDFYHETYHDAERKETSKYQLDQVRIKSIGGKTYEKRFQSIKSRGIAEEVVSLKDFNPHSLFEATTADGNGRVITGEAVTSASGDAVDVPHFIITDKDLCNLIRRRKKFFQNKMNDRLPGDESDPEDIKDYIRGEIQLEADPDTKTFKTSLIDEVYEMTKNSRTRSTIKNWVTQVYKERDQNEAGITCWKPQDKRYAVTRRALENSDVPEIAGNWENDVDLTHKKYVIYAKSTNKGNLEKDLGTRMVAKEHNKDSKKAICVFYTEATTQKKVAAAQVETFSKLNNVQSAYNFYDHIFALGQIKGLDSGCLLTFGDSQKAKESLENISELNANAAK
jgi:hypothetical protein